LIETGHSSAKHYGGETRARRRLPFAEPAEGTSPPRHLNVKRHHGGGPITERSAPVGEGSRPVASCDDPADAWPCGMPRARESH
jgi:hypothetical protein